VATALVGKDWNLDVFGSKLKFKPRDARKSDVDGRMRWTMSRIGGFYSMPCDWTLNEWREVAKQVGMSDRYVELCEQERNRT
jgi:hypothetical protein